MRKRERLISEMRAKQDGRCFYCGCVDAPAWHIDHKMPRSKGGTDLPENLALACAPCNTRKAAAEFDDFILTDELCLANPSLRYERAKVINGTSEHGVMARVSEWLKEGERDRCFIFGPTVDYGNRALLDEAHEEIGRLRAAVEILTAKLDAVGVSA